jgi:hypothetical protein
MEYNEIVVQLIPPPNLPPLGGGGKISTYDKSPLVSIPPGGKGQYLTGVLDSANAVFQDK